MPAADFMLGCNSQKRAGRARAECRRADVKQGDESVLRKALLPLSTGAVALGAFLGLPAMKALAQELKIVPRAVLPPVARLNVAPAPQVNPSAARLVAIADQAIADPALAERLFSDPDAVAAERNLSDHEKSVLRHMTREQFATAGGDAARVSAARLAQAGGATLPATATDARLVAGRMVVGRAILAAMGRSYLEAANAHACCPWGKAIELGLNGKRVLYDRIFEAPAELNVRPVPIQAAPLSSERG